VSGITPCVLLHTHCPRHALLAQAWFTWRLVLMCGQGGEAALSCRRAPGWSVWCVPTWTLSSLAWRACSPGAEYEYMTAR
jgi:hypothetical protein